MSDETVRRRLAAILSADAVGYSRLMAADEVVAARTLRAHLERMEAAITRHGGRVVDAVGDNLLAEFASIVEAAACAAEIQRELAERNAALAEAQRMPFRIGLHLGDVIVEGDRIRGDGVNVAARLEGLAPPGGLAISRPAFDQVEGRLAIDFIDLGELSLKNIPRPMRVYAARLGAELADALGGDAAPPHVAALPRPRTRFIGRGEARREIAAALEADRLVTLAGVGGCGKSRLAWQVADDVAHAFAAGVRSADLTSASASGQVPAAVAVAAGLVNQRSGIELSAEQRLVHGIGDRHLLLVLDNCEHVVDGAAEIADLLLSRCPRLAILATSREPLDIDGEHVWQVPPLDVAPPRPTSTRAAAARRSSSSQIARRRRAPASLSPPRPTARCGRSASASTAFRSRSSSRPRACDISARTRSPRASTIASACSPSDRGAPTAGIRRCSRRSSGAMVCSTSGSGRCSTGSRCSSAASRSMPWKRSVERLHSTRAGLSSTSARSWIDRSS